MWIHFCFSPSFPFAHQDILLPKEKYNPFHVIGAQVIFAQRMNATDNQNAVLRAAIRVTAER